MTVEKYYSLLNTPIFNPRAIPNDWQPPNVGTMVLNLLALKQLGGMSNAVLDMLANLFNKIVLPPGNFLPPT